MDQQTRNEIIQRLTDLEFHGHPDFYRLLADMAELHSRKNHDYAGKGEPLRNFYKSREQGVEPWRAVLIRLSDKWSRLESFCKQGTLEVKEESMVDTLMDNAVYSLIAILLYKEETTRNKENCDPTANVKMTDNRHHHNPKNNLASMPEEYIGLFRNGRCTDPCDMLSGPCACGASHFQCEWPDWLQEEVFGNVVTDEQWDNTFGRRQQCKAISKS